MVLSIRNVTAVCIHWSFLENLDLILPSLFHQNKALSTSLYLSKLNTSALKEIYSFSACVFCFEYLISHFPLSCP